MSRADWSDRTRPEVQRLVLSSYDADCSLHLVLQLKHIGAARAFIAGLLRDERVTFGDSQAFKIEEQGAINIGFTYHGLVGLELPERWLSVLRERAAAFCAGAAFRAARRLGDTAASAAEEWHQMFRDDRVDMLISIHGRDHATVIRIAEELQLRAHAREALDGWDVARIPAAHLPNTTKEARTVHFGFRDPVAMPRIVEPHIERSRSQHQAGELLLGYPNDENFDRWGDLSIPEDAAHFYRNASFGVLRKIEQHEDRFNQYLDEQVERLRAEHWYVTRDYLKAKMCGRWPNGALVLPTDVAEPTGRALLERLASDFDYRADPQGLGCPLGRISAASIRATTQLRRRACAHCFGAACPTDRRTLTGSIQNRSADSSACSSAPVSRTSSSIYVSEWIENKPMGPANPDRAKDPLVGQHDEPEAEFHIPQQAGAESR